RAPQVLGDRRWRERPTDRPDSLRRRKRQTLSSFRLSPFDKQHRNLVALECEVVAELDRTSWKAAADLSGDNRLVTDFSDVGHLGVRLVFFVHLIAPLPDCSAAVLSVLVGDERVFREGSNHGIRLVGISSLEIIRNRLRWLGIDRITFWV